MRTSANRSSKVLPLSARVGWVVFSAEDSGRFVIMSVKTVLDPVESRTMAAAQRE